MKQLGNKYAKLPESELAVMQAIWDLNAEGEKNVTAAKIMRYSPELARLKMTTVLTLITRLIKKGFLGCEKNGRANSYPSLVNEEEYKQLAAVDFVSTVYKNDAAGLISALYNKGMISSKELGALRSKLKTETEEKENKTSGK